MAGIAVSTSRSSPEPASNVVTSGPPYPAILRLALPTVLAMLAQSFVNEVDLVFFAHLPQPESSNAQAALVPSLIVLWLFGGSLSAVSVGTQAFTARRFAENKHEDAGAVLTNAAFFALVAGALFTGLGYVAMPHILGAILKHDVSAGGAHGAYEAAVSYSRWRLLGVTSMATTFALKAFFDGIGKTHVHLVASVAMNLLNVALCLVFIFGNAPLGVPRMGMAGAGVAGFISTYVGLAIMIGYALLPEYRAAFRPFTPKRLDRGLTWSILKLSIPSAIATIVGMAGFYLFTLIANRLDLIHLGAAVTDGTTAFEPVNGAATSVIIEILKFAITACLAFGTSTATLVAQSIGEKDPDKAERFGWASVRLGLLIFGVLGVLEATFAPQVLAFFTHSPAVQQAALGPMRLMGVCTPLLAVGMIVTQALFGAGNTRFVAIAEFVLHFTCLVPLAWVFGIRWGFGLVGIWAAAAVYMALLAGIMTWKFGAGGWKAIRL
jgi:multidrug resistance protein, MATE family